VVIRADLCGVWVAGTTTDYIFFEQATSRLHQEHIILHEIGHILCGHRPTPLLDEEYSLLLLPDLDVEMVRRVLRRRSYSGDQEQEAELLASLILKPAGRAVLPVVRQAGSEAAALLERLEAVLDQPPRGSA
jgi:hypothetical protein